MNKMQGLFEKFTVLRNLPNQTYQIERGCFVLLPWSDPVARIALRAYAAATPNQPLRTDIENWLSVIEQNEQIGREETWSSPKEV